ncbi:hypothetical protein INR49_021108 [Caranx melampygus]|nr:hypothetical protein INR49_021108 [Caranx melampygus]
MGQAEVEVKLPRFKMEETYDVNDVLKSMGMEDAFDVTKSNFSGISPANDLVLSKVIHKAFVEVNEEGTEAAAATGATMDVRTVIIPAVFNADHPFLFYIRHNPTKTVLFAGRFCCPDISSALAMVMLGAGGNTATQMSECLKTKDCEGEVHASFAQLLSELNKKDAPYALSVANRLYGEQSYQFVEDFLGLTRKHYQAELESVDFKTKSEEARVNINSWVEKQTQGKIQDVLAKGVVDNMTRLVLVNAIYFKGNWNKQFKANFTRDANFRLNKVKRENVNCTETIQHYIMTPPRRDP